MTNSAVKSSYLRISYGLLREHVGNRLFERMRFLSVLPSVFADWFSGLKEDGIFLIIFPLQ